MQHKEINDRPVWRDEKSGLPMHNHAIPVEIDGITVCTSEYRPCNCGNRVFDIPLTAVKGKDVTQGEIIDSP